MVHVDTWVERKLDQLPFVEWDRFTENECREGTFLHVYGWIEREKDDYKDFVLLEFTLWNRRAKFITTSSEKYSDRIHEILHPDVDGHSECQRVEDRFSVENAVELEDDSLNSAEDDEE